MQFYLIKTTVCFLLFSIKKYEIFFQLNDFKSFEKLKIKIMNFSYAILEFCYFLTRLIYVVAIRYLLVFHLMLLQLYGPIFFVMYNSLLSNFQSIKYLI